MNNIKTISRFQKTARYQTEQSLTRAARNEDRGEHREAKNHQLAAAAWQALGASAGLSGQFPAAAGRR